MVKANFFLLGRKSASKLRSSMGQRLELGTTVLNYAYPNRGPDGQIEMFIVTRVLVAYHSQTPSL